MLITVVVLGCVVALLFVWTAAQERNLTSMEESNLSLSGKIDQLTKQLGEVQGTRWESESGYMYNLRTLTDIVQRLDKQNELLRAACEAQHGRLEVINKPPEKIIRFAGRDA